MFRAEDAVRVTLPGKSDAALFDLRSGEAGEIHDKLRRFKVRLAIVCPPGAVQFSSRFDEILCDDVQVFDTAGQARAWLAR